MKMQHYHYVYSHAPSGEPGLSIRFDAAMTRLQEAELFSRLSNPGRYARLEDAFAAVGMPFGSLEAEDGGPADNSRARGVRAAVAEAARRAADAPPDVNLRILATNHGVMRRNGTSEQNFVALRRDAGEPGMKVYAYRDDEDMGADGSVARRVSARWADAAPTAGGGSSAKKLFDRLEVADLGVERSVGMHATALEEAVTGVQMQMPYKACRDIEPEAVRKKAEAAQKRRQQAGGDAA